MTALYWLDIAMNSSSVLVATALFLTVYGSGPRRAINLTFSLFIFIEAFWAVNSLLLRLALWLEKGNPQLVGELAAISYALMGPALLLFVTRYVSRSSRWCDALAGIGFFVLLLAGIPLFSHRLVFDPRLQANGSTLLSLSPAGYGFAAVPLLYILICLLLFWLERGKVREPQLPIGVTLFLLGFVLGGILKISVPILAITNTISVALFGYAVIRRQIFNPLRQLNVELESQVRTRTAELEQAYSEVEITVQERTAALKHEVGERKHAESAFRERARRLELIADIGRRTTAILGLDELLQQSVALIRDAFTYYNVSILLVEGGHVVLRATTLDIIKGRIGDARLAIGSEGITGRAAAAGEYLLVGDVKSDDRYVTVSEEESVGSELAVPIRLKETVIGVLDVQSTDTDAFSETDRFTMQTVADQLAIAVENARLYEETQRRADRLAVVNRIGSTIGTKLRIDDLLETVHQEITPIFQEDAFLIAIYDEPLQELEFRYLVDKGRREPVTRKPLGTGLASLVITEKRSLVYSDLEIEKDLPAPEYWGTMKLPRSWIGVPMTTADKISGVICLQSYAPGAYGAEELLLLTTIADQVAVALESARLYEEAQQELSERLKAEAVLRESEEKFRNLAEESPNMIFINAEERVVYANRQCEVIMGYSRGEFYDPHFSFIDLIAPEHVERIKGIFGRHRAGEDIAPYEYSLLTKDNRKIEAIITTKLIQYAGEPAILGIITDITNRKRTERLLHTLNRAALEMERALEPRRIFAAVGEELKELGYNSVVFLTDTAGESLRLHYFSYTPDRVAAAELLAGTSTDGFSVAVSAVPAFAAVLKNREAAMVQTAGLLERMLPESYRENAAKVAAALGVSRSIAAPLLTEDGVFGLFLVQAENLNEEDIPAIAAFSHQMAASWQKIRLMEDLSRSLDALKRTQEQLLQSQKMEAVGKLAGGVAHDFNNLLTAITGYADLLLLDCAGNDPIRSDLNEIKRTAERAGALTRQLLAFSRRQMLQPKVVNLNEIVATVEQMLRRVIGEDIELLVSLCPDLHAVKADPGQIEQVVMNLAVNARDAMPQGGYLTIETANRDFGEDYVRSHGDMKPGQYVMLAVSDTGIGMDGETRRQLFEPFFTTKEQGKGTGLGLSTVYGIVKQSGGEIWVYSEPGMGSTFKIYLPRVGAPSRDTEPPRRSSNRTRLTETILLAEDDEQLRGAARQILQQEGYTVLTAGRAREAFSLLKRRNKPIQMLITDISLPGKIGGEELAEKITEEQPNVHVLFISGYTKNAAAVRPGASFLEKPFSPDALVRKVSAMFESDRRSDP